MGDKYKSGFGVMGLYQKRGWFYYRPPTPRSARVSGDADGGGDVFKEVATRPPAVALKTKDLVTAIQRLRDHRNTVEMEHAARCGSVEEDLESYLADKAGDAVATRRARESILSRFKETSKRRLEMPDKPGKSRKKPKPQRITRMDKGILAANRVLEKTGSVGGRTRTV